MNVEIIYKNGQGRFTINLDFIDRFNQSEFKKLTSIIDISDDPLNYAGLISDHIDNAIVTLKEERENAYLMDNEKEKIARSIRKYETFSAILSDKYGTTQTAPETEHISLKRAEVYSLHTHATEPGKLTIKVYKGYKFYKFGICFSAYKSGCRWIILVASCGVQLAYAPKRDFITDSITPELIAKLAEKMEGIKNYEKLFKDTIKAENVYITPGTSDFNSIIPVLSDQVKTDNPTTEKPAIDSPETMEEKPNTAAEHNAEHAKKPVKSRILSRHIYSYYGHKTPAKRKIKSPGYTDYISPGIVQKRNGAFVGGVCYMLSRERIKGKAPPLLYRAC